MSTRGLKCLNKDITFIKFLQFIETLHVFYFSLIYECRTHVEIHNGHVPFQGLHHLCLTSMQHVQHVIADMTHEKWKLGKNPIN